MSEHQGDERVVDAWRDLLARHASLSCDLDRVLHEHGLGVSDFEVLDRLAEAEDGSLRMLRLGEEVHLSQSALSRLVSRLERDGLVTRSMCADDRRCISVWLTELGRRRHAAARPAQRAVLATHLTKSAATWESMLGQLALAADGHRDRTGAPK